MRFFEGDGDTSQTQERRCCEDMQLDITTGLENYQWSENDAHRQIKLDGHIVGQCFGHI